MTLPALSFRRHTGPAARYPLLWLARRLALNAESGQTGTYVNTSTDAATDHFGNNYTSVHSQPPWHYPSAATMPSVALKLKASASTVLSWPVPLIPQAMCGMIDFIENANVTVANGAIWDLSSGAGTGARIFIASTGSFYRLSYSDGTTTRTSTLAASPANNNRVRLRWSLSSTGVAQLWQSVEGAAESTSGAASAHPLPATRSGTTIRLSKTQIWNVDMLGCANAAPNQKPCLFYRSGHR